MMMLAVGGLVLALQVAVWQLWRTLFVLKPACARLLASDYPEGERDLDRLARWSGGAYRRGDIDGERPTACRMRFDDAAGVTHDLEIPHWVRRGDAPDAACILWYDPARPERVSHAGPGLWLLVIGGCVAGLWGVVAGMR